MNQSFGTFLKLHIDQQQLSLRQLSTYTRIDKATISRLINGKRQPTMQHLHKFADALHIPYLELLAKAGYPVEQEESLDNISDLQIEIGSMEKKLLESEEFKELFSMKKLQRILKDLRAYAATKKGQQLIHNQFENKLENIQGRGPFIDQLRQGFSLFTKQKTSNYQLLLIGSVLLYFIVPIDVIPDFLFPIGYIDDAIACQLVLNSSGLKGGVSS